MFDPIFIVGAPRSGTSMTAGVIDRCGAWGGVMRSGSDINPKGFFENRYLYHAFRGAVQDDDIIMSELMEDVREMLLESLTESFLLPHENMPWFLKHPGLLVEAESSVEDEECQVIWSKLHRVFPNAKWVIVRRDIEDILASQGRVFTDLEWFEEWTEDILAEIPKLKRSGAAYHEIWPLKDKNKDRIVRDCEKMIGWLGLEWNEAAVRAFIETEFIHHITPTESAPALEDLC